MGVQTPVPLLPEDVNFVIAYTCNRFCGSSQLLLIVVAFTDQPTTVTITCSKHSGVDELYPTTFVLDVRDSKRINIPR